MVEKAIARELLNQDYNVVIDDTNLKKDIWTNFMPDLPHETIDLTKSVSVGLCVQSDGWRRALGERGVGRAVINRMALEAGLIDFKDEDGDEYPIVICDIDGTIADLEHRVHFMHPPDVCTNCKQPVKPGFICAICNCASSMKGKKNHKEFYAQLHLDKPIEPIIEWLRHIYSGGPGDDGCMVILLSGRGEEYAIPTEEWLARYGVPYDYLFMRRAGDHSDDVIVKNQIMDYILKYVPKSRILMAIDDRPRVIEGCWRRRGIKVIPVNQDRWEGLNDLATLDKT